ncbi:hypothetical protein AX16_000077 [Volvariella volvacea WC 439]|nr:hypothetical protein AX16_000077 [Volvariella volvacea WC 439]
MNNMIEEGYRKFKGRPYRIPTLMKWLVLVGEPASMEHLRKAPDSELSFAIPANEILLLEYTIGREMIESHFHADAVRSGMNRNISTRFADVQDEIVAAFSDLVPCKEGQWVPVSVYQTMMKIICRSSNRLFVDLPMCRDEEYLKLNEKFTLDVVKNSAIILLFPSPLRKLAARYLTNAESNIQRGMRLLGPLIESQLQEFKETGGDSSPNNLITWLLQVAPEERRTVREMTLRILIMNFAAIHTTTMGFTHLLYDLAAFPEYVEPLREEAERVIKQHGWTRAAMSELSKIDSFVKECFRMRAGSVALERKAMKDIKFPDRTVIPTGTYVGAPAFSIHHEEKYYPDPWVFDAFRFSKLREQEGSPTNHLAVGLPIEWLVFGSGKHACPGRFFAVNEVKCLLVHVLLHYDIKFLDGHGRPKDQPFGTTTMPNQSAKILFRERSEAHD